MTLGDSRRGCQEREH